MTIVPTSATIKTAKTLIRATPEHGAEAAITALRGTPPEQIPALVALLARHAASVTAPPTVADLPNDFGHHRQGAAGASTRAQRGTAPRGTPPLQARRPLTRRDPRRARVPQAPQASEGDVVMTHEEPAVQPRPAICPACGLTADNAVVVRGELTAQATYVCTEGHLYAVTWVEVA